MKKFIEAKSLEKFIETKNKDTFRDCSMGFQVGYRDCLLALRDFVKQQPHQELEYLVKADKKRLFHVSSKKRKVICTNCEENVDKKDSFCRHCGANFTHGKGE